MNIFIIIAILIVNLVAVLLVYQFIKTLEKKEKLLFLVIGIAINYILVSIIYWFSSFGIEKLVTQSAKSFVTYMFVPVNVILTMPFIANAYCKIRLKKIKTEQLKNRCIVIAIVTIVVLVIEYFYFRNIQLNISNYNFIN